MTRAPHRSVNWWTASGYLWYFRAAFSAKLDTVLARDWTRASGSEVAQAFSNTRFRTAAYFS
jgi:hypothetical protein